MIVTLGQSTLISCVYRRFWAADWVVKESCRRTKRKETVCGNLRHIRRMRTVLNEESLGRPFGGGAFATGCSVSAKSLEKGLAGGGGGAFRYCGS